MVRVMDNESQCPKCDTWTRVSGKYGEMADGCVAWIHPNSGHLTGNCPKCRAWSLAVDCKIRPRRTAEQREGSLEQGDDEG